MSDGKKIHGCVYRASDPVRDIPVLAELAQSGRLDLEALVTRRIGIDDVETAFTDMTAGRAHAAWSASTNSTDRPGPRRASEI
jgi:S-(hydroxymethyl)glutathione dehydrogenase / alcohol dehydrogenase